MESGNGALYWNGRVVEADIDLAWVNQVGSVVREGVLDSEPEAIAAFVRSKVPIRGYGARAVAAKSGVWANIPPRCNRNDPICFSPYLYRARGLAGHAHEHDDALASLISLLVVSATFNHAVQILSDKIGVAWFKS
jgi:hypothetical protein